MEDYIDFSFVPRLKNGTKSWTKCKDTPIKFKHKEKEGIMKATFDKYKKMIKIEYDGRISFIDQRNLLKGYIGGIVFDTSHIYDIGVIKNGGIVKQQIFLNKNKNKHKEKGYVMECLYTHLEYKVKENHLKQGNFNPYLVGKKVWWGNWLYNQKHLLEYIKYKESAKNFHKKSHKKILCICPKCNNEKYVIIKNLTVQGFRCERCSRRRSYPERVMGAILTLNNIDFINEYIFNDLKGRRFDFYLPKYNTIIETHGLQHYEDIDYFKYDVKTGDKDKTDYCNKKGLNLIVVDCRKSSLSFIINEVKKIKFFKDFKLNEKDIINEMENNYGK